MECAFGDLVQEAIECGALDGWSDQGALYIFSAGTLNFRMRRDAGAGFLRALIVRRQLETLAARVGAGDVTERPISGVDAQQLKTDSGCKKLFRGVVALSEVRSSA